MCMNPAPKKSVLALGVLRWSVLEAAEVLGIDQAIYTRPEKQEDRRGILLRSSTSQPHLAEI